MQIQLRFFAALREQLNLAEQSVEVPEEVRDVGQLRVWLAARGAPWSEALGVQRSVRTACQLQMCDADTPLSAGCEVAFFPPVTGG